MDNIAKIIFDKLAARRGINLPDAGSLYVVREAAEFKSKRDIMPPHQKVVFSKDPNSEFESVVDILAGTEGFDAASAEETYRKWLEEAKGENGLLEINEVGLLKKGLFYPSVELHETLNPLMHGPVKMKKKSRTKDIIIWVAAIIIAVLIVLMVVFFNRSERLKKAERIQKTTTVVTDTRSEETAVTDAESAETTETVEDVIQKELEDYARTSQAVAEGPVYHLVAGVFSDPANADKMIAADRLGVGKDSYRKIEGRNGKVMVSAYSSLNRRDVVNKMNELYYIDDELWIHEVR